MIYKSPKTLNLWQFACCQFDLRNRKPLSKVIQILKLLGEVDGSRMEFSLFISSKLCRVVLLIILIIGFLVQLLLIVRLGACATSYVFIIGKILITILLLPFVVLFKCFNTIIVVNNHCVRVITLIHHIVLLILHVYGALLFIHL